MNSNIYKATFLLWVIIWLVGCSVSNPPAQNTEIIDTGIPVSGRWDGIIVFTINNKQSTVQIRLVLNETGNKIDTISFLDFATGITGVGKSINIENGKFEFINAGSGATYKFTGAFVASDRVEGTYEFNYSKFGTISGKWEAAPKSDQ